MSRRRFINTVCLVAVVIACGVIAFFAFRHKTPEGYYQGRSSSSWLREFFSPNGKQFEALNAFDKMGTNAEPVLMAALIGKENPTVRMYRGFCARMPASMQQHLHKSDDPALMRMAAVVVLKHSSSPQIISDLYPIFKIHDSAVRQAVLDAVNNRNPEAGQLSLLVSAGNDPDPHLRSEVWQRITKMGRAAASAAPEVAKLCSDDNIEVRQSAAWALWKITDQTNAAVPVLEGVLSQSQDAIRRRATAHDLLMMRDSNPFFVNTLINLLANSQPVDRGIFCSFLGEIGPPAAAAIPALRKAMQDSEPEVRRRAEVALSAIEPKHDATNSP